MSDPRDYKVDLSGAGENSAGGDGATASSGSRPYLSVHFACCAVYQRVYRDKDGKTYNGRCPRCGTPVRFVVGEGGTAARRFVVR
jgi:PHP family Zn ribbon phosphoesterase